MMFSTMPPPVPPTANSASLSDAGSLCPDTSPDLQGYVDIRPASAMLGDIPQSTHLLVFAASAVLIAGAAGYYTKHQRRNDRRKGHK